MSANDTQLKSWVAVPKDSDFPIQNLPYGVFVPKAGGQPRAGVAIGEMVLDLAALHAAGMFGQTSIRNQNLFERSCLNALMAAGKPVWQEVRQRITTLLTADQGELRDNAALRNQALHRQVDVCMLLPTEIGDYTDFYSSKEHASNVGSMFRDPKNPLLPNWVHLPVGYHGRTSSIVVSGVEVRRPCGQTKPNDADDPRFGPTRALDFELEVGFFTGSANPLGRPIPIADAPEHIFGMVLVNDWSARDIQKWEYVPLGPFLGKSFATSISPWVVTLDALEPFRVPGPKQDPPVLPHLRVDGRWAYDLNLEVWLQSAKMAEPARICSTNFRHMYWNILQQLAHQTSGGVNIRPGDLYASGTVSGSTPESRGSMLELAWNRTQPIKLPTSEERNFLADGDTVILRGWCQGDGYRVGFGECRGTILPALASATAIADCGLRPSTSSGRPEPVEGRIAE